MKKPEISEFNPYYQKYIDLVGDDDFLDILKENRIIVGNYFLKIPDEKHNYKYAPEKWTIKQVLMHIIDTERVFAYRALVCSRYDTTPLNRFDENLYIEKTDLSNRTLQNLIDEFIAVRKNSEFLFENMTEEQSKFLGSAVGHNISARALGYILIGHALHHINVIKERYL